MIEDRFTRVNEALMQKGRIVDRVLRVLFFVPLLFAQRLTRVPLSSLAPRKILVLESHLIGDVVMLTPLLQSLKKRFPNSQIDVWSNPWAAEILKHTDTVNKVIESKIPWGTRTYTLSNLMALAKTIRFIRREKFDLVVEPRGDLRNNFLVWLTGIPRRLGTNMTGGSYFLTDLAPTPRLNEPIPRARHGVLEPLGVSGLAPYATLRASPNVVDKVSVFLKGTKKDAKKVVIHPGASLPYKRLSPERVAKIANILRERGYEVILMGAPSDSSLIASVQQNSGAPFKVFQKSLSDAIALFSLVDCFVGMDSGGAHLASAVGCPTVIIMSHQHTDLAKPWAEKVSVIAPPSEGNTIEDIDYGQVIEHVEKWTVK